MGLKRGACEQRGGFYFSQVFKQYKLRWEHTISAPASRSSYSILLERTWEFTLVTSEYGALHAVSTCGVPLAFSFFRDLDNQMTGFSFVTRFGSRLISVERGPPKRVGLKVSLSRHWRQQNSWGLTACIHFFSC